MHRFESYVNRTETCWLWTGKDVNCSGHARFVVDGKRVFVHRFAWELWVGPIPEGLVLDHLCEVKLCVNPAHLEPVTVAENIARSDRTEATKNSRKTACPQGHPYDGVTKHGKRICRRCRSDQQQAYMARRR